ncbi:PepSY domain-containing protein [Spelaeicoccus albus]|uniref:Putative membrane protein YkoI n=1 Tax=Spelaeicoccus albus TaxID=1280376 RepID=A0A7Z0A995_9MICO|nr:PepSY domain-containing protein [Spelaeicoccus albus]NYI66757.1 putative membrane protein YkoI [Spelaeicoccus albus]
MTHRFRTLAAGIAIVAAGSPAACSQGSDSGMQSGGDTTSTQQSNHDNERSGDAVTRDEAGKVATDKYGGKIKDVDNDYYNGKPVWEVEIRGSDKGRIEVKVEKSTGKILHMKHDEDNSDDDSSDAAQTDNSQSGKNAVSRDRAGKIATDKYGGTVKNVESDDYNGKPAWEVEIRDSKQGRIEVKVEKSTGKILHMEHD